MPTLAERLLTARTHAKLTQVEAGEKIGVHGQSVSDWELGKTRPDQERHEKIAETYKVNEDWLFRNKGPMLSSDPMRDFMTHPEEYGVNVSEGQRGGEEEKVIPEIVLVYQRLSPEGREKLVAEAL